MRCWATTSPACTSRCPASSASIETQAPGIADAGARAGALAVVGVDPISLGVLEAPPRYGADIVCGELQPLGHPHALRRRHWPGSSASPDDRAVRRRVPDVPDRRRRRPPSRASTGFGEVRVGAHVVHPARRRARSTPAPRRTCGRSAAAVYLALLGAATGCASSARGHHAARARTRRRRLGAMPGRRAPALSAPFFKEFVVDFWTAPAGRSPRSNAALPRAGHLRRRSISRRTCPELGQSALVCVTEVHTQGRHRPARRRRCAEVRAMSTHRCARSTRPLERADAASSSPVPGERGFIPPADRAPSIAAAVGDAARAAARRRCARVAAAGAARARPAAGAAALSCASRRRRSGNDVNIHLGLGTCTMKYSPKVNEELVRSPQGHRPAPAARTTTRCRGCSRLSGGFERILCEISGLDRFTFQPGGGSAGACTRTRG